VFGTSQGSLPARHATLTRDSHPRPRRDWNPQSQQARGRRPMH